MPVAKTKPKPSKRTRSEMQPDVLTLAEAADYLRVSEDEVLRMAREQGLYGRLIGTEWRFLRSGLQQWLSRGPSEKERVMRLAGA